MDNRIFVRPGLDKSAEKPAEGQQPARLKVRKPVGGRLAEAGEWQNLDHYWMRRIADGDVEVDKSAVEPIEPSPAVDPAGKAAVKTK